MGKKFHSLAHSSIDRSAHTHPCASALRLDLHEQRDVLALEEDPAQRAASAALDADLQPGSLGDDS